MDRRNFLSMSGLGIAGLMIPFGKVIAAEELLAPLDVAKKKAWADAALTAARGAGAGYCDVRIGKQLMRGNVQAGRSWFVSPCEEMETLLGVDLDQGHGAG